MPASPPPSPPPLDLVTVAIAIATWLFGPEVAEVIGTYTVIVLGAVIGAAWSTSRQPTVTRPRLIGGTALIVGLALLVTVPLTELAAHYAGVQVRVMFGPVAAVVGGIGHDWPAVFRWAARLVRGRIERHAAGSGDTP